mmetsp:Transcript_5317/g.9801  ORF Transcript_5317/g.9801 Transcript_5317/m.9801 type:complete len:104 (+) Transcript_5317:746-1057(+)
MKRCMKSNTLSWMLKLGKNMKLRVWMMTLLTMTSKLNSFGKSSKLAMFAFVLFGRVARSITFLVYFVLPDVRPHETFLFYGKDLLHALTRINPAIHKLLSNVC